VLFTSSCLAWYVNLAHKLLATSCISQSCHSFSLRCSLQLIPAADGFDHVGAQKDAMHLPAIQRELGAPYSSMLFFDGAPDWICQSSGLQA
jgi:hypothetical protein